MESVKRCYANSFGNMCPLRDQCRCFCSEEVSGVHQNARFIGETCVNFVEIKEASD